MTLSSVAGLQVDLINSTEQVLRPTSPNLRGPIHLELLLDYPISSRLSVILSCFHFGRKCCQKNLSWHHRSPQPRRRMLLEAYSRDTFSLRPQVCLSLLVSILASVVDFYCSLRPFTEELGRDADLSRLVCYHILGCILNQHHRDRK